MSIENMIPYGQENAVTRDELCAMTGLSDRKLRELIAEARRNVCIINLQDGRGYFRPLETEKELVKRYFEQERARAKTTLWAIRGAKNELRKIEGQTAL